jgi:hypothetical protein
MLRERRALLEADILKLTRECGEMYLKVIKTDSTELLEEYNTKTNMLARMQTYLIIINHMITEGKE